jgi:hypothetical protein
MNTEFLDNEDFLQNIMGFESELINFNLIEEINDINSLLNKKIINNYQVLGEFNFKKNMWYWSYILPKYSSNLTLESRNLLNYGAKIDENNNQEQLLIKNILINSSIKIKEYINIIFIINVAQYLLKDIEKIYKKKTNDTIIFYIVQYNK